MAIINATHYQNDGKDSNHRFYFPKCYKMNNCRRLLPSLCSLGSWRVCDFQRHDSFNPFNGWQRSSLPRRALPPLGLPCRRLGPCRSFWHQPSPWCACSCQTSSWSPCSQVPASHQQRRGRVHEEAEARENEVAKAGPGQAEEAKQANQGFHAASAQVYQPGTGAGPSAGEEEATGETATAPAPEVPHPVPAHPEDASASQAPSTHLPSHHLQQPLCPTLPPSSRSSTSSSCSTSCSTCSSKCCSSRTSDGHTGCPCFQAIRPNHPPACACEPESPGQHKPASSSAGHTSVEQPAVCSTSAVGAPQVAKS